MARPKSNGPYAPLSATYYRDDAILAAGEQAELLFVRCLAFLADAASDGYITDRQMRAVVGMGMRNVPGRVQRLVDVGLLSRVDGADFMPTSGQLDAGLVSASCRDGAYLVRAWLKWNKTTDEIGKHLKRDRERKHAEKDTNSTRNEGVIPDGIQTDSSPQITTNQYKSKQVNTQQHGVLEVQFDDAYSHWPKKVERKAALEKFKAATKRVPADVLAEHIIRFGDAYAATTDKRYTPALGVWLGHERWTDELPTAPAAERKPTRTEQNLDFVAQLAWEQEQQQRGIEA